MLAATTNTTRALCMQKLISMDTAVSTKVVPQNRKSRLVSWVERIWRGLIEDHGVYQQEKVRHKYICAVFLFETPKASIKDN